MVTAYAENIIFDDWQFFEDCIHQLLHGFSVLIAATLVEVRGHAHRACHCA